MQNFNHRLRRSLALPFLLISIVLASCSTSNPLGGPLKSSKEGFDNRENRPATDQDVFFYQTIGLNFLCSARTVGVEFPKSLGLSVGAYVRLLREKHGGFVAAAGEERLTNKQLIQAGEMHMIEGAMRYCPEYLPDEVKTKFEEYNQKLNNSSRN